MSDPKLQVVKVTIHYLSDDGYQTETTYDSDSRRMKPLGVDIPKETMLNATEELARLCELFGMGDEMNEKINAVRLRVQRDTGRNVNA
jgi:hypothetical protein